MLGFGYALCEHVVYEFVGGKGFFCFRCDSVFGGVFSQRIEIRNNKRADKFASVAYDCYLLYVFVFAKSAFKSLRCNVLPLDVLNRSFMRSVSTSAPEWFM